jgi:hypothetical protein
MLLTLVIAGAVVAPVAISAIAQRGASEIEGSDSSRVDLERAASIMLRDHPLGVGADNFVLAANTGGYYIRAGVDWSNFRATVHNLYWLTLAENGYLGLAAYVIFLLAPLTVALRCGVRHRRDIRGDLLIGLGVALLLVYMQNFEEWIFITYRVQYVFVMDVGLIAGLAIQLGYWRVPRSRRQSFQVVSVPDPRRGSPKKEVARRFRQRRSCHRRRNAGYGTGLAVRQRINSFNCLGAFSVTRSGNRAPVWARSDPSTWNALCKSEPMGRSTDLQKNCGALKVKRCDAGPGLSVESN